MNKGFETIETLKSALNKLGLPFKITGIKGEVEFDVGSIGFHIGEDGTLSEDDFIAKMKQTRDDIHTSQK